MGSRVFAVVVVLTWATTMTWLMRAKILPPFYHGEPPQALAVPNAQPVGWTIELNDQACGFAITQAVPGAAGTTEIHSRVVLQRIPLPSIAPSWMQSVVSSLGEIKLDTRSRTTLDSFKNLATFETRVRVNDLPSLIRMSGGVQKEMLRLKITTGDFERTIERPFQSGGMLGSELTPEPKLISMYVGRKWRKEVYSPLASPSNPVELLEAEVMEEVKISHREVPVRTRRIEFRTLSSVGVSEEDRLRAVLWVDESGHVLRQDAYFMNVRLRFERETPARAVKLASHYLELHRYATMAVPTAESLKQDSQFIAHERHDNRLTRPISAATEEPLESVSAQ